MQYTRRPYDIGIKFLYPPNLTQLQTELPSLKRFAEATLVRIGSNIHIESNLGNGISGIRITSASVYFEYQEGPIEVDYLANSFREAINIAKDMDLIKGQHLGFNPNWMTLRLGSFDGEVEFLAQTGTIASHLQRILYLGGSPSYYESSKDFVLFLGLEAEFGKRKELLGIKEIKSDGTVQPADSLDELLARLAQKPP